ncbi:hypothetical protein AQI88_35950 [Streptomyces cellostaticus]|uniref:Uncharacterized protein n=1 Tax=Streptomyces cellostaticus TaxID=67285 RepID=A0A101NEJ2_9ACTN|nr:hypothetical protein [Streptomyces cellostaticus]KUM91650.1 hypothetical protein AQI88_35950 [Streptomyces cellostaticus]GHI03652.1 hypothetical protein Scel_19730 [Streptomyces cellostaticus]
MTAQPEPKPAHGREPVPRDLPDQQARPGGDPWEAAAGQRPDDEPGAEDVPEPDEAGTGPRGAPRSATVHPEHPTPQEPSD